MHREVLWDWRHRSYQRATISVANAKEPKHQMCASRITMSKAMRCEDINRWQCVNWKTTQQMHANKSRDIEATQIMLNPLDMSIQNPTQCRAITMIRHAWLKIKRRTVVTQYRPCQLIAHHASSNDRQRTNDNQNTENEKQISLPCDASQVCNGEKTQWIVGVIAQLSRTDAPNPKQELRTNRWESFRLSTHLDNSFYEWNGTPCIDKYCNKKMYPPPAIDQSHSRPDLITARTSLKGHSPLKHLCIYNQPTRNVHIQFADHWWTTCIYNLPTIDEER